MTLLRWPLWVIQLFTGAKSFVDNPVIGSRRLNGMGLHRLRVRGAAAMTASRRRRLAKGVSAQDREALARHGYVEWRNVLPADQFARMRAAIMGRAWPAREMIQGHAVTRRIAVDAEMLRTVPDLKALLASSRWRGLMRYVASFRGEPVYYIQTILTRPGEGGADPQNVVHADAFHSSMKAWLFLHDVPVTDGPLTYVPGSHRLTAERLDWEDERALALPDAADRLSSRGSLRIGHDGLGALGLPQPHAFAVPENTLVVADMFGFHARGGAERPSIRVELWAYARRNPFLPWVGLNFTGLPGLAERRVPLFWRLRDLLQRWIGQPWRDVGPKRPDAP